MDGMATTETSPGSDPLSSLGYEEARDELVRVVAALEQGQATLEESIALWERGEALARHCEEWLIGAKARLDAARAGAGSAAGAAEGSPATASATAGAADPE
jgi:exodeoxyribonuclease VII small subunit